MRSMNGTIQNRPGPRRPVNRPNLRTTPRSHWLAICGDCIRMTPTTAIAISGIGLPTATSPRTPIRSEPISIATATTLIGVLPRPGSSERRPAKTTGTMCVPPCRHEPTWPGRGPSGPPSAMGLAERGDHIVEIETGRVRVGLHARDERAQPPIVLSRRVGLRRRRADEGADAAPRFENAGALELRVDARHRVGVDFQIDRELPDGRQLIARLQPPRGNRRPERAVQLRVNR